MLDKINKAGNFLGKTYDDLIHPVLQPTGEVLGFLPRSLRCLLQGWEKWIINGEESIRLTSETIKKKIEAIPEERLTEPEPYVVVPAIQQLGYSHSSEELRELYANLIVSSMDIDKKEFVHPAFVDILKKLTPDEARIIEYLKNQNYIHYIDIRGYSPDKGAVVIQDHLTTLHQTIHLDFPNNELAYLQNLVAIGLLQDNVGLNMHRSTTYFKKHVDTLKKKLSIPDIKTIESVFSLTNFGQMFVTAISE